MKLNKQIDKPNILIVMTDHQRWDTVLPEHACLTPNTDAFAREGLIFNQTYCPMSHCCPARATFFSGLYPSRHGVWNNVNNAYAIRRGPYDSVRMFSQDLRDVGYDLAYTGKWHVSAYMHQEPKNYGWRQIDPPMRNHAIQDEHQKWEHIRQSAAQPDNDGEDTIMMPGYHSHALYGEKEGAPESDERTLARAMEELPKLAAGDKPWVLYVGWNAPHAPYFVDRRYLDMYDINDIELPPNYYDEMNDKPDYYKKLRQRVFDQLSENSVKEAIRHFYAMCTKVDDNFGKLLNQLDDLGQKENTLVLFCSDHGDYVGDHGLFHKQVPAFIPAYRVPAVVRWPQGLANPDRVCDAFVSLADFAPTFLDMAGVSTDRYFTGRSLTPFFRDETPADWRREMCTQCEGTEQMFTQRMVITQDHKYVYNGFGRDELYDLCKDPYEMCNLEDDPAYEAIKRDLVGRMWRFAYQEQDRLGSTQYLMVNTAPWGPKEAFRTEAGRNMPTAEPNPQILQ